MPSKCSLSLQWSSGRAAGAACRATTYTGGGTCVLQGLSCDISKGCRRWQSLSWCLLGCDVLLGVTVRPKKPRPEMNSLAQRVWNIFVERIPSACPDQETPASDQRFHTHIVVNHQSLASCLLESAGCPNEESRKLEDLISRLSV